MIGVTVRLEDSTAPYNLANLKLAGAVAVWRVVFCTWLVGMVRSQKLALSRVGANELRRLILEFTGRGMVDRVTSLRFALTAAFASVPIKRAHWRGFVRKSRLEIAPLTSPWLSILSGNSCCHWQRRQRQARSSR